MVTPEAVPVRSRIARDTSGPCHWYVFALSDKMLKA